MITEREHLWKQVVMAKDDFREYLRRSKGRMKEEDYNFYRDRLAAAQAAWDAYLERMAEPGSLA